MTNKIQPKIRSALFRLIAPGFLGLGALLLAACAAEEWAHENTGGPGSVNPETVDYSKRNTLFGKGGLNFFGDDSQKNAGGALGVNSFLWRASLDTISFMPVNSADAFGGVIITDWHTLADAPKERFKLNVYILGRTLRADGVRVAVFRQVRDPQGTWKDAGIPEETGIKIEDAILTRARQLRNQSTK
ncbi:MAG: DUF3576 domain-containing protein [Proteobacteria bacterium]|nr:DUF3576 domain-containing protein [Pseudomonadota bacterium]MDA1021736.1 DUF3576 domain-containing protein [Pseudomonadota bacterium]